MDRHLHEDLFQQMKMNREMFEGKDYPTQWALNPSMYQNMSNDQVDWAALAQQWIQMKETVVPPAPPPPSLSNDSSNDERGEAPMDMDTKDDDVPPAPPAPNISGSDNWNQWSQWGQWNASAPGGACWEWSGVPPPGVIMGADGRPMGIPGGSMPAVPPAPNISGRPGFSVPPPAGPGTSPYSFNSVGSSAPGFNQVPGYWGSDHPNSMSPGHAPPFLKGMRHPRMPHLRNDPNRLRNDKEKTPEEDSSMTIDAAKRRQLPAWIREGLEKMEREKHRAEERERQEMLRQQELEARKIFEEEARAVLNPSKSKFDSDSEKEVEADSEGRGQEEEQNEPEASPEIVVRARRSRFRDADSPEVRLAISDSPPSTPVITNTAPVKRSREEILQDVMLKVRRSLTEILLEVTNEEISSVCREVWSRARVKAPAGDTRVASSTNTAPLAQITRKLGLGIYGDSNSESEEEQDNQATDDDDGDDDSEIELKETLRRRQAAFKKTEEEIEARLAEDEEAELRDNAENTSKYENHMGNDTSRAPVDENEISNEREPSESRSNGGHTPRRQIQFLDNQKMSQSSPSKSIDSTTSSTTSQSSSSDSEYSDSSRSRSKKRRKRKSRSKSRGRRSRSSSRSRSKRSKHKGYRSVSPSRKSRKKVSRERKRRSRSRSDSRSRSRRRSRSPSRRSSRERRRSRSRSRNRKRSSRSFSRERGRSRSYGHYSSSKRRTRSRSKERRRSRSKSRSHRDGKKSSHRYRD